jgi:hypothetical protein
MKRTVWALVLFSAVSFPALAGEIYGKVVANGKPPAAGTTVGATCAGAEYPAKPVTPAGEYHIVAGKSGPCTITVATGGQSATLDVVSYDDPVQCDIVLTTQGGKLTARRK